MAKGTLHVSVDPFDPAPVETVDALKEVFTSSTEESNVVDKLSGIGRGLIKPISHYVDLRDVYEATVEESAAKGELAEKLYPTKASD